MTEPVSPTDINRSHRKIAGGCVLFVGFMLGAAYAAVPLYDMFCRATGFGGTTQVATAAPASVLDREMTIRFDGNVSRELNWAFQPEVNAVKVKVGETKLVMFKAKNLSDKPLTGTATYNVTPETTGAYFSKLECFCFTKQTLQPGEEIEMPVAFFVDPSIADERELDRTGQITLSYTFFPVKDSPVAAAEAGGPKL